MQKRRLLAAIVLAVMLVVSTLMAACGGVKTFTVSFDTKGGTTVASVKVAEGETLDELPITMKDGYDFAGWYTSEFFTGSAVTSVTPTEDVTLYAKWVEKGSQIQYSVVLNAVDGEFEDGRSKKTIKLIDGSLLPKPEEPKREGYLFVGWFKDETLSEQWDLSKDAVVEDIELYAKYKLIAEEHDVVFYLNYEGAGSSVKKSTESGKITYKPERKGYEFRGWWFSDGVNGDGDVVLTRQYNTNLTVTEDDLELYADWVEERTSSLQLPAPVITLTQDPKDYRDVECSWQKVVGASGYKVVIKRSGEADPVLENTIKGTSINFDRSWEPGSYTITVRANGDGINNVNSSTASRSCSYKSLGAVTGLSFDQYTNMLTWYDVANAQSYKVTSGSVVIAEELTVTKVDLSALQAGSRTVTVTASAEKFASTYGNTTIGKLRLATPQVKIEVDPDTETIYMSWEASTGADTYIVKLDNNEIETEETEYTLTKSSSAWGNKTSLKLTVNAFDSKANYLISANAKEYGLGKLNTLTVTGMNSSYNQKLSVDTFVPYSYEVTFEPNGGSLSSSLAKQTVTSTNALEKPTPTRSNYVFRGWFTDEECKKIYDFNSEITKDFTLYAGWYNMSNNNSTSYKNRTVIDISKNYNTSSSAYFESTYNTSSSYINQVYFVAPKTGSYTFYYRNYNSSTSTYYNLYFGITNLTQGKTIRAANSSAISASSNSTYYSLTMSTINAGDVIYVSSYRGNTNSTNYYSTFYFYVTGGELNEKDIYAPKNLYLDALTDISVASGSNNKYSVMAGSVVKLSVSIPNNSNYKFDGWYAGDELISDKLECEYEMPNKNVTVTPKFK